MWSIFRADHDSDGLEVVSGSLGLVFFSRARFFGRRHSRSSCLRNEPETLSGRQHFLYIRNLSDPGQIESISYHIPTPYDTASKLYGTRSGSGAGPGYQKVKWPRNGLKMGLQG